MADARTSARLWIPPLVVSSLVGVLAAEVTPALPQVLLAVALVASLIGLAAVAATRSLMAFPFLIALVTTVTHIAGWSTSSDSALPGLLSLSMVGAWNFQMLRLVRSKESVRWALFHPAAFIFGWPFLVAGATATATMGASYSAIASLARGLAGFGAVLWTLETRNRLPTERETPELSLVTGYLVGLAPLALAGSLSAEPFYRFEGIEPITTHGNLVGLLSVLVLTTCLGSHKLTPLERLPILAATVLFLGLSDSRAAVAAAIVAISLVVTRRAYRAPREMTARHLLSAAGVILVALVVAYPFLTRERVAGSGVLTGRPIIWTEVVDQVGAGSKMERAFGQLSGNGRVQVGAGQSVQFTAHNALLGVWQTTGYVGVGFTALGVVLYSRQILRRREYDLPVAFYPAIALFVTIPVETWVVGATALPWIALSLPRK